jgi:hypothetical protein
MGISSHKRSLLSLLVTLEDPVGLTGPFSCFALLNKPAFFFMGFVAKVLVSPCVVHMGDGLISPLGITKRVFFVINRALSLPHCGGCLIERHKGYTLRALNYTCYTKIGSVLPVVATKQTLNPSSLKFHRENCHACPVAMGYWRLNTWSITLNMDSPSQSYGSHFVLTYS